MPPGSGGSLISIILELHGRGPISGDFSVLRLVRREGRGQYWKERKEKRNGKGKGKERKKKEKREKRRKRKGKERKEEKEKGKIM